MPSTNYTVATASELNGSDGTAQRSLRHENRRLENLQKLKSQANEILQNDKSSAEPSPLRPHKINTEQPNLSKKEGKKPVRGPSPATDIYFSPLVFSGSQVELSDPIHDPELTPMQERFSAVEAAWNAAAKPDSIASSNVSKRPKLTLEPEGLDRLVVAMANAPMIQRLVTKEPGEKFRLLSDRASFLTHRNASRELKPKDSVLSLRTQSSVRALRSQKFPNSISHIGRLDFEKAPSARLQGLAIMEPKPHPTPLSYWSPDWEDAGKIQKYNGFHYLHVPFDSTSKVDCRLRIEPGSPATGKPASRVFMQLVNPVKVRKTGKSNFVLVAEVDVTESFRKAAFTELIQQAGWNLNDIEIESIDEEVASSLSGGSIDWCAVGNEPSPSTSSSTSIDWCAVADDLQSTSEMTSIIDTATAMFLRLEPETCMMQTLTLMSELERIKRQHQDFLIVQASEPNENKIPTAMCVPWMSEHLDFNSEAYPDLNEHQLRAFRDELIRIATESIGRPERFTCKVQLGKEPFGKEKRIVHFVPVVEPDLVTCTAWVCFIRDQADFQYV